MKLSALFAGQRVRVTGADVEITHLAYDSRKVVPGTLFAAWAGSKMDGHQFIPQAVERGAAAILSEHAVDGTSVACVVAADARAALAQAGQVFFSDPAQHLAMVGVTGTSGKTTTVHLIESILRASGRTPGMIGTLGTRYRDTVAVTGLTTPDAIDLLGLLRAMLEAGVDSVAMEVSSHALSMQRVAGVSFDVGVFTNLTQDHLDYHATLDQYFAAKTRLFTERLKPHGVRVLNWDDPRVRTLVAPGALSFSQNDSQASISVSQLQLAAGGTHMRLRTPVGELALSSALVGRFNVENILAAVGATLALGLSPDRIAAGVAALRAVPGRLELVSMTGEPQVLVDYAHKPDALEKALLTTREMTRGRLFCVIGCGGDRDKGKRAKMGEVAAAGADWTIVTNDNPRSEAPEEIASAIEQGLKAHGAHVSRAARRGSYVMELDRHKAIELAIHAAKPGDTVLIAGKGHETYQIVGDTTLPFDDRVVARAALAERSSSRGTRRKHG